MAKARMGHAAESSLALAASGGSDLHSEALLDGRYRVIRRLGGGGMGEVYEVEHVRLKRHFALKLLRSELAADRELSARFDRETRAVAMLRSDHVVSVVDAGALGNGRPYFVMERLYGQDLKQILAEHGQLAQGRAVSIGIDICLGLHAAHAAGLVHRDLKPENVFITRSDEGHERAKLLDFGVVKLTEHDHTRPGALLGTARYMAPEQVRHDAEVGPAADLFALGVLLYRCLSGEHPFAADSLERVLFRVMNETPAALAAPIPAELSRLLAQALAKTPTDRPASALDFARALARFSPEPRSLEPAAGWRVATALSDQTMNDGELTPVDREPVERTPSDRALAISGPMPSAPGAVWALRPLPALAAAALLVGATLGAARWLFSSATSALSAPAVASTVRGGPVPDPQSALQPSAASSDAAAVLATAEPKSLSTNSKGSPPVRANPRGSAAHPEAALREAPARNEKPAASAGTSVNWFDPRNPYEK